jgi:hypothetical protein
MTISITSKLSDGLEVPFIYEINSYEEGIELVQDALKQGAEISEVLITN